VYHGEVAPLGPPPDDEIERRRVRAQTAARLFGRAEPVCVGRFELRERLGAGGAGTVYSAWDPELEREVALKLLRRDVSGERGEERQRLLLEARAMARLNHPNVVPVFELGVHEGRVFLAMERVDGTSLRAWLERTRPAWPEILRMFVQAGRGLVAAHAAGIVHRDFKPENVLVGPDGRARVGDFGLAHAGDRDMLPAGGGTPAYMAPEQHTGAAVGPAVDQFAFAAALYQALYGRRAFAGDTAAELAAAKAAGAVLLPPGDSPIPPRLFRALKRALAPDPARRFASLDALLEALERDPRRRVLRAVAAAVIVVVLAAALLGAVLQLWMFSDWMRAGRRH
jgi:serine/threonine protein kinase